jgi:hypothetical protein
MITISLSTQEWLFLPKILAQIAAVSPDFKKQGFLAVVFLIGNKADSWKKLLKNLN